MLSASDCSRLQVGIRQFKHEVALMPVILKTGDFVTIPCKARKPLRISKILSKQGGTIPFHTSRNSDVNSFPRA